MDGLAALLTVLLPLVNPTLPWPTIDIRHCAHDTGLSQHTSDDIGGVASDKR
jgi:hypothetical protein